jgi:RNA polymerase sigma-70 factor, ECF subfamily
MAMAAATQTLHSEDTALSGIFRAAGFGQKTAESAQRRQPEQPCDLATYNRLVLENQDAAYNLACYLLGDPDLAEDATQKAFIKAYLQLHQYKGPSFRAWLLAIVRNACYDELRKIKSRPALSLESLDTEDTGWAEWLSLSHDEPGPEEFTECRERDQAVRSALLSLNEAFRSVIVLVDLHGLDYQEASQALGVPIGTIKSRLARARRQLTRLPELARLHE